MSTSCRRRTSRAIPTWSARVAATKRWDDDDAINMVWPIRPNPGTNRAYQTGIDRPDGTPREVHLGLRAADLPRRSAAGGAVRQRLRRRARRQRRQPHRPDDDGTTLRARKAYERGEFLASTDERFRPVYLSNAPDGTLYIVDMYRGVIQQRADVTAVPARPHRRAQTRASDRARAHLSCRARDDAARYHAGRVRRRPPSLVAALSHPNGWRRDTAQQLLVERARRAVVPDLTQLASSAPDWRTRLHALWTLDGIDGVEPATVSSALDDPSRDVRVAAMRIAERWLGDPSASDPGGGARSRSTTRTGRCGSSWPRRSARCRRCARGGGGVAAREAAETIPCCWTRRSVGCEALEPAVLERVAGSDAGADASSATRRSPCCRRRSCAADRMRRCSRSSRLFADEARPAAQCAARSCAAPRSRCSALRRRAARTGVAAVRLRRPVCRARPVPAGVRARAVRMRFQERRQSGRPRTPSALTCARFGSIARRPRSSALAAGSGELSTRAAAVLSRIGWPDKPGSPAAVAPLSAAEQQRFNAGQEVYRNVCQACHQPDGRGQEKLAAPLVNSTLALARPDIPIRILLHGKEGAIGLMPPVGQVFSDEQIADVLTYVRREWGQEGSPVDPGMVAKVRAATADRQRPWTDSELRALVGAAPPVRVP